MTMCPSSMLEAIKVGGGSEEGLGGANIAFCRKIWKSSGANLQLLRAKSKIADEKMSLISCQLTGL